MAEAILVARDLVVSFGTGKRPAVAGASLEISAGDAVGIVGESGSGKTTLARALVGILPPSAGRVEIVGRSWSSISPDDPVRRKAQMIFQDPYGSLDPHLTGRKAVAEVLQIWGGGSKRAALREAENRLAEVGLSGDVIDRRPGRLSGGQCQRVGIARALACDPDVLVADEPTSSLDVSVQATILNMLISLRESRRLALVFISHDLSVVRYITERAFVMYRGRVVEAGQTERLLTSPSHPYTRCLVDSIPGSGGTPDLARHVLASDEGCVFARKCSHLGEGCQVGQPPLVNDGEHCVACLYPLQPSWKGNSDVRA